MLSVPDGRPAVFGASCSPPTPFPARLKSDNLSDFKSDTVSDLHLPGLRAEWRRLARRLSEGDVELESETVSVLVLAYDRLRAAGGAVDAMAAALVEQLRLQLADAEAFVDG